MSINADAKVEGNITTVTFSAVHDGTVRFRCRLNRQRYGLCKYITYNTQHLIPTYATNVCTFDLTAHNSLCCPSVRKCDPMQKIAV